MDPEAYKALREAIGSTRYVAQLLGISRQTIWEREKGRSPIGTEAELALRMVHLEQNLHDEALNPGSDEER